MLTLRAISVRAKFLLRRYWGLGLLSLVVFVSVVFLIFPGLRFIHTTPLFQSMSDRVPSWASTLMDAASQLAAQNPGPTVTAIGFLIPFLIFLLARPDRRLQRRRIYMDLEFESARIFRTCVDHPEIVRYLEGSPGPVPDDVPEKVYWHVCQVLNTFELMISLYKEGMVHIDIFSTWVAWFHELGTADRFSEFWYGRGLSFHYKLELQEIMNNAQDLLRSRKAAGVTDDEIELFHRNVAVLFGDYRILRHFRESQRSKLRGISTSTRMARDNATT